MITQKNKEFINFFYLEIKGKIDKETESSISNELLKYDQNIFNTFEENRQNGENDSYICKLIQQDLIIEFIQYVNKTNYQISAVINSSLFETNSFLLEQQPTLIEYAAFYGSIQIFQYLLMNNVELSPSLWLFAIHGRNAELIHLLEQIRLIPSDKSYYKCFEESIKCHHNEIAHYIQENLINKNAFLTDSKFDPFFKDNEFSYGFHYFNYEFFPKKANYRFTIHYACKYGYLTIVKLFSAKNDLKTKEEIIISKKTLIENINEFSFENCRFLKQITIPPSFQKIEKRAFHNCSSLTQIVIPSSITDIESDAFNGCESLKKITIPALVKSIGECAFKDCVSLVSITILSNLIEFIKSSTFFNCSSLTEIKIPSSVIAIGKNAFEKCSSLNKILIPSSVVSIKEKAFNDCFKLKEITFENPSSLESIGESAFMNCVSLQNINIPSSVTSIDKAAFGLCTSLKNVSFQIPSSLTAIESEVFWKCESLDDFTVPYSVTSINFAAFADCSSLKQIYFHSNVYVIERWAFRECKSLTRIKIPPKVQHINESTFDCCTSLNEIIIPPSVISIEKYAFFNCISLHKIDMPPSVQFVSKCAFYGSPLQDLYYE